MWPLPPLCRKQSRPTVDPPALLPRERPLLLPGTAVFVKGHSRKPTTAANVYALTLLVNATGNAAEKKLLQQANTHIKAMAKLRRELAAAELTVQEEVQAAVSRKEAVSCNGCALGCIRRSAWKTVAIRKFTIKISRYGCTGLQEVQRNRALVEA